MYIWWVLSIGVLCFQYVCCHWLIFTGNDDSNYYFLTLHSVNTHRHLEVGLAVFSPRKSVNLTNQDFGKTGIFFLSQFTNTPSGSHFKCHSVHSKWWYFQRNDIIYRVMKRECLMSLDSVFFTMIFDVSNPNWPWYSSVYSVILNSVCVLSWRHAHTRDCGKYNRENCISWTRTRAWWWTKSCHGGCSLMS